MTVQDLIDMLKQHDLQVRVMVHDDSGVEPGIAPLACAQVQATQYGTWESNGMLLFELWDSTGENVAPNGQALDGPYPGVVLGTP